MLKGVIKLLFAGIMTGICTLPVSAQFSIQHQPPASVERNATARLEFLLAGVNQSDINRANLFYRYDGELSYSQVETMISNGLFTVPVDISSSSATSLEYYFEVELNSGEILQYPVNDAPDTPVEVQITEGKGGDLPPRMTSVDYSILSPLPENGVTKDDVLIAIALYYDIDAIAEGEFRLFLDNKDVTAQADTGAYYISYRPEKVDGGQHKISLRYYAGEEVYLITEWDFYVVAPGRESFAGFGQSDVLLQGQAEVLARNQVIAGDINNALIGQGRISGRQGDWSYALNSYLTTQESSRLQPQNRISLDLRYSDKAVIQAGHVYPTLSDFTISGRRMFGLNSELRLLQQKLHLQFIYGALDRKITNQYDRLLVEEQTGSSGQVLDTTYTLTYQNQGKGAFQRKVLGARAGFGNPNRFQFGIQALKIKDDSTSLFNVRDYTTLLNADPSLYNNLSQADREKLQQNPDILSVQGGNVRPKDNIIAGADLSLALMQNRIRFEAEGVASAQNDNIYGGPLTVERAEDLGFDLTQDEVDLLERLSWLIIINENMTTLPIRVTDDASGNNEAEPFFPTSILANRAELSVNYPDNNLRIQYRWIGPNFNSLANSTIRKDVAGFTISDRFSLLDNRIYMTLGYENLNDNVVGNKQATTETRTYRSNVSWYPVDRSLPRVNLGLRWRNRDNDVQRFNPLVPAGFENAAVQNLRRISADSLAVTATPRSSATFSFNTSVNQQFRFLDLLHDASLSYFNLNTTDDVFAYGDVSSQSLSMNLTTRFDDISLRTRLGLSYNKTKSGSGQSEVRIFGMYAGGDYFLLDNKLNLNGRLAFTSNETASRPVEIAGGEDDEPLNDYFVLGAGRQQSDFGTYVLQAGARYDFDSNHSLLFESSFTNVSGSAQENDRLVQLRYIYRF